MKDEIILFALLFGMILGAGFTIGSFWLNSLDDDIEIYGIGRFVRVSAEPVEDVDSLLQDNLDYCKNALNDERSVARELWDDYFTCAIASDCQKDKEECEEFYEIGNDAIEYVIQKCYYAENYEKYFVRYE